MSVPLIVNGVTYNYPQEGDVHWGPVLTAWSTAVTNGMLQKAGGSFPLTAEVDFGSSFGIAVKSIKSKETNISSTGFLRLGNASPGLVWRNAANSADLPLTVNSSNQLTFNGTPIAATASLTNSHIFVGNASNFPADVAMSGDITITNAGVTAIGAGKVTNSLIQAAAGISVNKLAALSASQIAVTDGSGFLTTFSTPTLTELLYVAGVTSAIQTQLNNITSSYLPLAGGTMAGALNMASHKITSVTPGTAAGEAVAYPTWKDRGDPSSPDFTSFTTDNAYHDLDLSSIVPAGTSAVCIHLTAKNSAVAGGESVTFRKKGNTNSQNVSVLFSQVANVLFSGDCTVAVDSNRFIQYLFTNGAAWSSTSLTVKGYYQ